MESDHNLPQFLHEFWGITRSFPGIAMCFTMSAAGRACLTRSSLRNITSILNARHCVTFSNGYKPWPLMTCLKYWWHGWFSRAMFPEGDYSNCFSLLSIILMLGYHMLSHVITCYRMLSHVITIKHGLWTIQSSYQPPISDPKYAGKSPTRLTKASFVWGCFMLGGSYESQLVNYPGSPLSSY